MTTKNKLYSMVDIETLDTKSSATILSIGAVVFDKNGLKNGQFYLPIDIQSCLDKGLTINGSTLQWWMKQSKEAQSVFFDKSAVPLEKALIAFKNYIYKVCGSYRNVHMVGNSNRFDLGILENAYHACGIDPFWNPFLERDYRSWKEMNKVGQHSKPKIDRGEGTYHNAKDDAIAQANHAIELNKYYGGIIL